VGSQKFRQVVAGPNLRQAADPDELEPVHPARLSRARSAGSSRSSAIASE